MLRTLKIFFLEDEVEKKNKINWHMCDAYLQSQRLIFFARPLIEANHIHTAYILS